MSVVVVGWILVLLGAFGLNHARDVRHEAGAVGVQLQRTQLRAWARSGVELARSTLADRTALECAVLVGPGAENPLARTQVCGEGRFCVGARRDAAEGSTWAPGLGDEAARLPVAGADSAALGMLPGMTRAGVARLLDARAVARSSRLPPFALLGLDEPSLACARRYLSRYGHAVNVNTAGPEVLRAAGLPASAVDKILQRRLGRDGLAGTADDRLFPDLESTGPALRECGLGSAEAAVLAYLVSAGRLAADSRYYQVAVRGWAAGRNGICELRVILEKPDRDPVRVVEWSENWLD
ncbi:MAG: hypothetical protein R6X35_05370 [Candidatus Krumholzibacteriia bacterium]